MRAMRKSSSSPSIISLARMGKTDNMQAVTSSALSDTSDAAASLNEQNLPDADSKDDATALLAPSIHVDNDAIISIDRPALGHFAQEAVTGQPLLYIGFNTRLHSALVSADLASDVLEGNDTFLMVDTNAIMAHHSLMPDSTVTSDDKRSMTVSKLDIYTTPSDFLTSLRNRRHRQDNSDVATNFTPPNTNPHPLVKNLEKQIEYGGRYAIGDSVRLLAYVVPLAFSASGFAPNNHFTITVVPAIAESLYTFPQLKPLYDLIKNWCNGKRGKRFHSKQGRYSLQRALTGVLSAGTAILLLTDTSSETTRAILGFLIGNIGLRYAVLLTVRVQEDAFNYCLARHVRDTDDENAAEDEDGLTQEEDALYDAQTSSAITVLKATVDFGVVVGTAQFVSDGNTLQQFSIVLSEIVYTGFIFPNIAYTCWRRYPNGLPLASTTAYRGLTVVISVTTAALILIGQDTTNRPYPSIISYGLKGLNYMLMLRLDARELADALGKLKKIAIPISESSHRQYMTFSAYNMVDIWRIASMSTLLGLAAANQINNDAFVITVAPLTGDVAYLLVTGLESLSSMRGEHQGHQTKTYILYRLASFFFTACSAVLFLSDSKSQAGKSVIAFTLSALSVGISGCLNMYSAGSNRSALDEQQDASPAPDNQSNAGGNQLSNGSLFCGRSRQESDGTSEIPLSSREQGVQHSSYGATDDTQNIPDNENSDYSYCAIL